MKNTEYFMGDQTRTRKERNTKSSVYILFFFLFLTVTNPIKKTYLYSSCFLTLI
jgi:hypothetical protein